MRKNLPEKITVGWLQSKGACIDQVYLFSIIFPNGARINKTNIRKARKSGLYWWWLLDKIFTSKEYDKIETVIRHSLCSCRMLENIIKAGFFDKSS